MWPFRRKHEAPAANGPRPAPAPVVRRDWAALPPIQRTVGDHPLTAPSDRFSGDLATHHDPSVISDQMGHQVSADAPSGIVLTAARTASTRSDGPAMIPRPRVQRRADDAVAETGEWDGDEAAQIEARPDPVPAGVQRMAVVERPVVAPVAEAAPLTMLPAGVEPAPLVTSSPRRSIAPFAHVDAAPVQRSEIREVAAPRLTLGQARRLGLGAPITKVPDRTIQRASSENHAPSDTESERPATPEPPNAAEPAGVSPRPPSLSATQGDAAATVSPIATSLTPADQVEYSRLDLPLAPRGVKDAVGLEPSTETSARLEGFAPLTSVQTTSTSVPFELVPTVPSAALAEATPAVERVVGSPGESMAPVDQQTADRPNAEVGREVSPSLALPHPPLVTRPLQRVKSADEDAETMGVPSALPLPPPFIAPLVSARPIATLQRSTEVGAPDRQAGGRVAAAAPNGDHRPTVEQSGPAATPGRVDHFDVRAVGGTLQRSIAESSTSTVTPNWRDGLAPPGLVPASSIQPALPQRGRQVAAPALPLAPVLVQRERDTAGPMGDLPLAPVPAVIQRSEDARGEPAPQVIEPPAALASFFVQRAPWDVSRAAEAAVAPEAAAPAAAAGPSSERDMDELARKLYDRIRSRLRSELLVDRERAGLLTDWR